ncbi:hypothetical protein V8B97DRAFT_1968151 [Scleroderma yunnanense]
MIWHGTDDLQGYLRDAILPDLKYGPDAPKLPPMGHKSHCNTLSTRFKKCRHLTGIHYLGASFDEMINDWIKRNVPRRSVGFRLDGHDTGEILTVPSARKFKISSALPAPVTDFTRLSSWVDHFPLQTIQGVLHIIFPQTKDWGFISDSKRNDDQEIYKEFYFTDISKSPSLETAFNSVVVACQPPWILSQEDIWQFTELKSLPVDNGPLRAKERLWAKLWDSCVRRQSTYFIVTSYQQWVFGVFSRGFTNAFVSPPIDARSRDPTVMHAILYWLVSALAVEDGYAAPHVPEPVGYVMGDIVIPPSDTGDDKVTIPDSLSSWTDKSEEAASSAHAAEVIPLLPSEMGNPEDSSTPYIAQRSLTATRCMVERWRQTLPSYRSVRDAEAPPLSCLDRWTDDLFDESAWSVSSDDHTEVGETKGHWLTHA